MEKGWSGGADVTAAAKEGAGAENKEGGLASAARRGGPIVDDERARSS